MSEGGRGKPTLLWVGAGAVLVGVVVAWFLLPLGEWIQVLERWFRDLGPAGVVVFALAYMVGTVILAPGSAMSILGGLLFGWWESRSSSSRPRSGLPWRF